MTLLAKYLTVWFFGGVGAASRYAVERLCAARGWSLGDWMGLPTLIINVPACFLIGLFAGYLYTSPWNNTTKATFSLAAMTGFCGGFSTFSSYTLDSIRYFEQGRLNVWVVFGLLTLFLSLFLCAVGYWLGKRLN